MHARPHRRKDIVLYFHKRPPEALKFSDPYIFADDLNILAVAKTQGQIKSDLEAISNWVDTNGLSVAPDKCYKLEFRGTNCLYKDGNINFEDTEEVKDLGIFVKKTQLVRTC